MLTISAVNTSYGGPPTAGGSVLAITSSSTFSVRYFRPCPPPFRLWTLLLPQPSHPAAMDTQPATLIHGLPPPGAPARHANQQLVFDFTKRKRWADLLVTELTEAIMLVLSDTGVVWYCGPAVEDLLGWADEDLVDGTLFEIMNGALISCVTLWHCL